MDPMDQLFELYLLHMSEVEESARRLNTMYPEPSDFQFRYMSRQRFEEYVKSDRTDESKRLYLLRILDGHEELLSQLPESAKSLLHRRAA